MQKTFFRLAASILVTPLLFFSSIAPAQAETMSTEGPPAAPSVGAACDTLGGQERALCNLRGKMAEGGEPIPGCAPENTKTLTSLGHTYCTLRESMQRNQERANLKGPKNRALQKALKMKGKGRGQQEKQERQRRQETRGGIQGAQVLQSSEANQGSERDQMRQLIGQLKEMMKKEEGVTPALDKRHEFKGDKRGLRWTTNPAASRVLEQEVRYSARTLGELRRRSDEDLRKKK